MSRFEREYAQWLAYHKSQSRGGRLRRLEEGHGEPEKLFLKNVWWEVVGNLEYLHPEYEVFDFKGGPRFIDYAYIRKYHKIAWEILGFGPHWRDDRWKFGDDWVRHCDLVNDGWIVMPFAYDYIDKKPRICQRIVQQTLGRLFGTGEDVSNGWELSIYEERLVRRLKQTEMGRVTPNDASRLVGLEIRAARGVLKSLSNKGILIPDQNAKRIRVYSLAKDLSKIQLL